jgi:autotransporter-associated beta strand protein
MGKAIFYKRSVGCVSIRNSVLFPLALAFSFLIFGLPQIVHGGPPPSIQYWDNPATLGTWHTSFWSATVGGGGSLFAWTNGNSAVFSTDKAAQTGNYSVTLDSDATVQDFTYRSGNSGSTFTLAGGNTITMQSAQMNVAVGSGTTMIIDPTIAGAGGLTIAGGGTVVLANAGNSYTGGTKVILAFLSVNADGDLGNAAGSRSTRANCSPPSMDSPPRDPFFCNRAKGTTP